MAGLCSLPDAITAANTDTATGGCPAGSGDDTISLTTNHALSASLPDVTSTITIDGGYYTISMPGTVQMIRIAENGDLRLSQVRVKKSDRVQRDGPGGFIDNSGTLRVDKSSFSGSRHQYRGAIRNTGTLTVDSSFFEDNHAQWFGGAIRTSGTATIKNSTFSGNSSRQGGAINVNVGGSITIINSTFYGNEDSYANAGSVYFGMMGRSAHIYNSIMAGSNSVSDCNPLQSDFIFANSFTEDGCLPRWSHPPSSGNVNLGALVRPADGSPPYYPLLAGSVALGAGDPARCPATDQLGNARPNPSGSNCDMGAVESNLLPSTATPTATMTTTGSGMNSEQDPTASPTTTATATATRDPDGVPINMKATVGVKSITLDWDAPPVVPDGYLVWRRLPGEVTFEELRPIFAAEVDDPTILVDQPIGVAGTYEYTVQSIFLDGSSYERSEAVTVTVREADLVTATDSDADRHGFGRRDSDGQQHIDSDVHRNCFEHAHRNIKSNGDQLADCD